MKERKFPEGWDKERVDRVVAHYESQSEEEATAEDGAAWEGALLNGNFEENDFPRQKPGD